MVLRKYCQILSRKHWWGSPSHGPWVAVKLNFCGFEMKHSVGLLLLFFSYRTQMWMMQLACQPWSLLGRLTNTGITSHVSEMWPPLRRSWQHWVTGREEHFSHWNWDKGCPECRGCLNLQAWWLDGDFSLLLYGGQNKRIRIWVVFVQLLLAVHSMSELNFII